jgi:hypothetical protein
VAAWLPGRRGPSGARRGWHAGDTPPADPAPERGHRGAAALGSSHYQLREVRRSGGVPRPRSGGRPRTRPWPATLPRSPRRCASLPAWTRSSSASRWCWRDRPGRRDQLRQHRRGRPAAARPRPAAALCGCRGPARTRPGRFAAATRRRPLGGDAFLLDAPVASRDLAGEPRWPDFRPLALAAGIGAWLSTPVRQRHGPIGGARLRLSDYWQTEVAADRSARWAISLSAATVERGPAQEVVDCFIRREATFGRFVGDDVARREPGQDGQDLGGDGAEAEWSGQRAVG